VRQIIPSRLIVLRCVALRCVALRCVFASDHAADAINLKISKVGGLTKARALRDLATASGIPMNIEDTWCVIFVVTLPAVTTAASP